MSQLGPFCSSVHDRMAEIFATDYAKGYRPLYERAAAQHGQNPVEPEIEIVNAFDHFAKATEAAIWVDTQGASTTNIDDRKEDAKVQLELGRRHIWFGAILSTAHVIESFSFNIAAYQIRHPGVVSDADQQIILNLEQVYLGLPGVKHIETDTAVLAREGTDEMRRTVFEAILKVMREYAQFANRLGIPLGSQEFEPNQPVGEDG